jgi:hypothetical protein
LGYAKAAVEMVDDIEKKTQKAEFLGRIAEAQASSGQVEEALKLAKEQNSPFFRTKILLGIARGLVASTSSQQKVTKQSLLAAG